MTVRPTATKLLAPALPAVLVRRPHLHAALAPAPGRRLSLVVGPPGAGKTTLVREWLDELPDTTRWGWLSVDPDDGDPSRLMGAIVAAIRAADPSLARNAGDLLADADPDPDAVVAALADELVTHDGAPVVVVLDDVHQAADPASWRPIGWLIDHQPPQLHLVLTSRADPPLPLARWRARGQLGEVRAAQLNFSRDEAYALLCRTVGEDAAQTLCNCLYERTEGWAAGLRLACLAVEGGASPDDVVARFAGDEGTVAELLVAEVLDRQPPDVRRFLLQTSILATLEPALCDAVSARTDSALLLRRLAADHLFIRALEGQRDQYRHHQLLAELLQTQLRFEDPCAALDLHRRAGNWYEANGAPDRTISHALAMGDHERAVNLIAHYRDALVAAGHSRAMGRWLASIPGDFIAADPARAIDHATSLLLIGRPEAHRWVRSIRHKIPADAHGLQSRVRRLDAVLQACAGCVEEYEACMAEAEALATLEPVVDPWSERAAVWRSRLLVLVGRHDDAIAEAEQLLASDRAYVRDDVALSLLASALVDAGRIERGSPTADLALERWRATGAPELVFLAEGLRARAIAHRRAGQYSAAAEQLEVAQLILEGHESHLIVVLLELEAAELELATGRVDEAVVRLDRLYVRGQALPLDRRVLDEITARRRRAASPHARILPLAGAQARPPGGERLSERELVVLRHLASHLTLPELASELLVSRNTIKTQVAAVYRKLGASSRSEAVELGRELGLVGSRV